MGFRKRICKVLCVLAFSSILVSTASAWAQNTGSDDQTEELKNSSSVKWVAAKLGVTPATASAFSVGLNFVAMVTLIGLFLGPRLPAMLRNRTQAIGQALDEARKASADAKQRLSVIESSMLKLESEISAMQSVADRESQAEEERIAASVEEEKRRIAAVEEQEILAAVNQAKRDFRTYVAGLAVTMAANRLQVAGSADEEILQSFIYQLGRNGSN